MPDLAVQDHSTQLSELVASLGGVDAVLSDAALQQKALDAMEMGQRLTIELVSDALALAQLTAKRCRQTISVPKLLQETQCKLALPPTTANPTQAQQLVLLADAAGSAHGASHECQRSR